MAFSKSVWIYTAKNKALKDDTCRLSCVLALTRVAFVEMTETPSAKLPNMADFLLDSSGLFLKLKRFYRGSFGMLINRPESEDGLIVFTL